MGDGLAGLPAQGFLVLVDGRAEIPCSQQAIGEVDARHRVLGMDPAQYLADSDSYTFFRTLGDTVDIGYMDNNLRDVRVWLDFGKQ